MAIRCGERQEVLSGKAKFGIFGDGKEVPLVAWARLRRRKHDIPQLIAGALAGTLVTLFVFGWLGKLL